MNDIITHSDHVEALFAPYKDQIGGDYDAYRGHVYRVLTHAMAFLDQDEALRPIVEAALVYHDIGLWVNDELAYLEPSIALALADNEKHGWGFDPKLLEAIIYWHHKVTPYRGENARVINAVRKADWIAASGGMVRKGISRERMRAVHAAIDDHGFGNVLMRLAKDLGGSLVSGNLRVVRHVFKW